jgi:hypothetical protein
MRARHRITHHIVLVGICSEDWSGALPILARFFIYSVYCMYIE